ncbi:hypothetical protein ABE10_02060 [Bacillus toyonensis]|nr:hypothetical protein [Bacillus toyonensis]
MSNEIPLADWHPDPTGRHQYRYWDGSTWTDHVADNGVQGTDPLMQLPVQSAERPMTRREMRQQARSAREEAARRERERAELERLAREVEARREAQRKREERELEESRARERLEAKARALREAKELEARAVSFPPFYLPGCNGRPETEVAGEFARIDEVHRALGRSPKLDQEIVDDSLVALLVPEPSNPHDRNAVKVMIGGHHVGYLE